MLGGDKNKGNNLEEGEAIWKGGGKIELQFGDRTATKEESLICVFTVVMAVRAGS